MPVPEGTPHHTQIKNNAGAEATTAWFLKLTSQKFENFSRLNERILNVYDI